VRCILGFVLAVESLLDETAAVLQEVVANLATGAGEVVKGIEINIRGDLGDDAGTILDEISFANKE